MSCPFCNTGVKPGEGTLIQVVGSSRSHELAHKSCVDKHDKGFPEAYEKPPLQPPSKLMTWGIGDECSCSQCTA